MPSVRSFTASTEAGSAPRMSAADKAANSASEPDRRPTTSLLPRAISPAMVARLRHTCDAENGGGAAMSVSMPEQEATGSGASGQNGTGARPKVLIHQPIKSIPWSYEVEKTVFAGRGVDIVIPED